MYFQWHPWIRIRIHLVDSECYEKLIKLFRAGRLSGFAMPKAYDLIYTPVLDMYILDVWRI